MWEKIKENIISKWIIKYKITILLLLSYIMTVCLYLHISEQEFILEKLNHDYSLIEIILISIPISLAIDAAIFMAFLYIYAALGIIYYISSLIILLILDILKEYVFKKINRDKLKDDIISIGLLILSLITTPTCLIAYGWIETTQNSAIAEFLRFPGLFVGLIFIAIMYSPLVLFSKLEYPILKGITKFICFLGIGIVGLGVVYHVLNSIIFGFAMIGGRYTHY